jgi:hypothetical protein
MRAAAGRRGIAGALVALIALSAAGCSVPWRGEKRDEVNVAFQLEKNLPIISVDVNGVPGRFLISSALEATTIAPKFAARIGPRPFLGHRFIIAERVAIRLSPAVRPLALPIDGILGMDAFRGTAISIDYAAQLLIIELTPHDRRGMTVVPFSTIPAVPVTIDGRAGVAIVDTASPDSIVLPAVRGSSGKRTEVELTVDGHAIGRTDAALADTVIPRLGNRVLSKFLVTIDYRLQQVALWPRQP